MDPFRPIPYVGSFQTGRRFRGGDALTNIWRQVERVGTIENLRRVTSSNGFDEPKARTASLRVRQAVELRRASLGTSLLTRPLLLYYSALNLARGVLLGSYGEFGGAAHGLKYAAAPQLLDCSAVVSKSGTFPRFHGMLINRPDTIKGQSFTLRDLLGHIPELLQDYSLLNCGSAHVAYVRVQAFARGDLLLTPVLPELSDDEFSARWRELLPWFKDICEYKGDKTLRVLSPPTNEKDLGEFLHKHLIPDTTWRDKAIWYDTVTKPGVTELPRLSAYLGALFVLSNVTRYEPELLSDATEGTDLGFVLGTFLDAAERCFPQLLLGILFGQPVYFN